MRDWRQALIPQLCEPFRSAILALTPKESEDVRELRIRAGSPFFAVGGAEHPLSQGGVCDLPDAIRPTRADCTRLLEALCGHSLYAREEQMRCGFLTLRGGFRVGLAGHALAQGEDIARLTNIGCFNIRIAREVRGCASRLLPHIMPRQGVQSTLILSAPGLGKTTMLRDAVRAVSEAGHCVSLADERGEIAACYEGVPQLDIGPRTDVLDGCPKEIALSMLLRSMSPRALATDELGSAQEAKAVLEAARSGVAVLATAHAPSYREAAEHSALAPLLPFFPCVAVLAGKPGGIGAIYHKGRPL